MSQNVGAPSDNTLFTRAEQWLLLIVGAVQFVNILDFMMVMPLGPDFAKALDIPSAHLGQIAASYGIAAAISGFAAATFLDRFDRRKALAVAMLGLVIGTAAGGFAWDLHSLIGARVIAGAFGGPATALSISIVSDAIPVSRRGKAMGRVASSFAVASIAGVPFSLSIASHYGWRAPFFFVAGLGLIVTAVALSRMKPMTGHLTTEAKTGRRVTILDIVGRYESRISLSGSLLVLAGNFALIPNISSYVQFNLGYPRAELDRLYLVGGVASFITLFFVGKWVDKYGAPRIAWIGALLYTVIVVLGFVHPIAAVPVLAIFPMFMVASSFRMIALNTLASRVPAAPERARFQSAQSAIQQVGSSAGALAASAYLTENPATHALIGIREIAYISLFINLVIPFIVMALARALAARERQTAGYPAIG
jgi:predicted MFS family arabinose efflux permease